MVCGIGQVSSPLSRGEIQDILSCGDAVMKLREDMNSEYFEREKDAWRERG